MGTYTLEGLADFILKLFKEENEEQLWEVWLNKPIEDDFKTFKEEQVKKAHQTKYKIISIEEEKRNIKNSMKFIKPRPEGGE
jgi:ribonuclease BN (tRNA processing enzyme)